MNPQENYIQHLIGGFLASRKNLLTVARESDQHIDHDMLAAFTEGTLTERESTPIVSHLVDCGFCRHVTAELIRLDTAFAEQEQTAPIAAVTESPGISAVLSELFSKIFGGSDGEVFAHQEEPEEEAPEEAEEEKEENS
jgi:hypothetical protein